MKIHKAIGIKSADKLMVRVWYIEKPKLNDYSPTSSGKELYGHDMRNWKNSYKEYELHPEYVHLSVLFTNEELEKGVVLDLDLIDFKDSYAILKDKPVESDGYPAFTFPSNSPTPILSIKNNSVTFKGKEFTIEQFVELLNKIEL